jgi:hypothetical protein
MASDGVFGLAAEFPMKGSMTRSSKAVVLVALWAGRRGRHFI